ncbi:hypothetical protein [Bacillus multifaciens]|uniref:hypothetical protein n=1 Tax=Bacillus multifaciens TaxID=3068506 RepID=UPI002740D1A9|nr:hypothetical protein [Bacillus sp. WLY-B-L8]MDP7977615.1 hypothetical protein [Bacillus sp. WLY-B-L8]
MEVVVDVDVVEVVVDVDVVEVVVDVVVVEVVVDVDVDVVEVVVDVDVVEVVVDVDVVEVVVDVDVVEVVVDVVVVEVVVDVVVDVVAPVKKALKQILSFPEGQPWMPWKCNPTLWNCASVNGVVEQMINVPDSPGLILCAGPVNLCTILEFGRQPPGQFPPLRGPSGPGPDTWVNGPGLVTIKHKEPTKPVLSGLGLLATTISAHPVFGPLVMMFTVTVACKGWEPGHGPSPVITATTVI